MWIELRPGEFAFCDRVSFSQDGETAVLGFGQYRQTTITGDAARDVKFLLAQDALAIFPQGE